MGSFGWIDQHDVSVSNYCRRRLSKRASSSASASLTPAAA